jgi:hypothetical protein
MEITEFEERLYHLINYYAIDSGTDTPDFILARYLSRCLDNYTETLKERDRWLNSGFKLPSVLKDKA